MEKRGHISSRMSPINRTIGSIWDSFLHAFFLPPALNELQNILCTESPSVPNSEAGPHVRTNNKGKCCHISRGKKVQSNCHFYKHYLETRGSSSPFSATNKTLREHDLECHLRSTRSQALEEQSPVSRVYKPLSVVTAFLMISWWFRPSGLTEIWCFSLASRGWALCNHTASKQGVRRTQSNTTSSSS